MKPRKSILDQGFKYTPSYATNVGVRIRKAMRKQSLLSSRARAGGNVVELRGPDAKQGTS